ncbi:MULTISPECIES: hypothetical protein [Enterobacter cloacae complex]
MNPCFPLIQRSRSGAHLIPTRTSGLNTCRCYTHLGASQDSRAGHAL